VDRGEVGRVEVDDGDVCRRARLDPTAGKPQRVGASRRRQLDGRRGGHRARVVGRDLSDHRRVAHLVEEVEVVVRGRAVGAERDGDARLPQACDRGHPAREFHVRGRTVDDRGVGVGEQVDLRVVDVNTVCEKGVRTERAELVGVLERALAALVDDRIDLVGGLVGVEVNRHVRRGRASDPVSQVVLVDRRQRVGHERGADSAVGRAV